MSGVGLFGELDQEIVHNEDKSGRFVVVPPVAWHVSYRSVVTSIMLPQAGN